MTINISNIKNLDQTVAKHVIIKKLKLLKTNLTLYVMFVITLYFKMMIFVCVFVIKQCTLNVIDRL